MKIGKNKLLYFFFLVVCVGGRCFICFGCAGSSAFGSSFFSSISVVISSIGFGGGVVAIVQPIHAPIARIAINATETRTSTASNLTSFPVLSPNNCLGTITKNEIDYSDYNAYGKYCSTYSLIFANHLSHHFIAMYYVKQFKVCHDFKRAPSFKLFPFPKLKGTFSVQP